MAFGEIRRETRTGTHGVLAGVFPINWKHVGLESSRRKRSNWGHWVRRCIMHARSSPDDPRLRLTDVNTIKIVHRMYFRRHRRRPHRRPDYSAESQIRRFLLSIDDDGAQVCSSFHGTRIYFQD